MDLTISSDGAVMWLRQRLLSCRTENRRHPRRIPLPNVVNTGLIFGNDDGVYIGAIKKDGQGEIVSVSATGKVQEYNLPQKYLLPAALAIDSEGGIFMTVSTSRPGQSISMIWQLQLPSTKKK